MSPPDVGAPAQRPGTDPRGGGLQVWSVNQGRWFDDGQVQEVAADGSLAVTYDGGRGRKWVMPCEQHALLRAGSGEPLAPAAEACARQQYAPGDVVLVWSVSHDRWVEDGCVQEVLASDVTDGEGNHLPKGSVFVTYNNGQGQKWVLPLEQEHLLMNPMQQLLRDSASLLPQPPAAARSQPDLQPYLLPQPHHDSAAATHGGGGPRPGDAVHVWSASKGRWLADGTVEEVALEDCVDDEGRELAGGSVLVNYDGGSGWKWVPPRELGRKLRCAPEAAFAFTRDFLDAAEAGTAGGPTSEACFFVGPHGACLAAEDDGSERCLRMDWSTQGGDPPVWVLRPVDESRIKHYLVALGGGYLSVASSDEQALYWSPGPAENAEWFLRHVSAETGDGDSECYFLMSAHGTYLASLDDRRQTVYMSPNGKAWETWRRVPLRIAQAPEPGSGGGGEGGAAADPCDDGPPPVSEPLGQDPKLAVARDLQSMGWRLTGIGPEGCPSEVLGDVSFEELRWRQAGLPQAEWGEVYQGLLSSSDERLRLFFASDQQREPG